MKKLFALNLYAATKQKRWKIEIGKAVRYLDSGFWKPTTTTKTKSNTPKTYKQRKQRQNWVSLNSISVFVHIRSVHCTHGTCVMCSRLHEAVLFIAKFVTTFIAVYRDFFSIFFEKSFVTFHLSLLSHAVLCLPTYSFDFFGGGWETLPTKTKFYEMQ